MKTTILLLTLALASAATAQQALREQLEAETIQYQATVAEAANVFLNQRLSPERRLKAIEPHAALYDEKQVAMFQRVVADPQEPPEIRAAALARITEYVPNDERIGRLILNWLGDPRETMVLRRAALRADSALAFQHMQLPTVYQKMLDDPEPEFRLYAFSRLVSQGDARAQQKLIEGLKNPEAAPLPAPTAIAILSSAPKSEALPTFLELAQNNRDPAARVEAIRLLGGYEPARKTLVEISRNASEKDDTRAAALSALYAGDRENIVQYATPILTAEGSPELQALAIQMTATVRQDMKYRFNAKSADTYDRLVEKLSREGAPQVRKAAQTYVETVRPKY
jgi:HEAT repeat protein